MWTFRLRLHLTNGQQEDLFGTEAALATFREGLRRSMDDGREGTATWHSNGGETVIAVGGLERIGDLEPVIPASFTFGARARQT